MRAVTPSRAQVSTAALLLVNAAHPLPLQFAPELVPADPRSPEVLLERQAAHQLQACIQAIGGEKSIALVSGYRTQAEQQSIYDESLRTKGEAFTRQYVAIPGCSEHQTGLAIDLGAASGEIDFIRPAFPREGACGAFRRAAADYGFVLRYPAGKEAITGIAHEPWHFRYVGLPHAKIMEERALTLEEYLSLLRREHSRVPLRVKAGGHRIQILYRRREDMAHLPLEEDGLRQISEDNCGGFVLTLFR